MTDLIEASFVIEALQDATDTLRAARVLGYSPRLAQAAVNVIHDASEAYGWTEQEGDQPPPPKEKIDVMEEIFGLRPPFPGWITAIPARLPIMRRAVFLRANKSLVTGKPMSWRRIADVLGSDHRTIKRLHEDGIARIVDRLNRLIAEA